MEAQYNSAGDTETLRKASHSDGNASRSAMNHANAMDDGGRAAPEITPPPKLPPAPPRKALLFVGVWWRVRVVEARGPSWQ